MANPKHKHSRMRTHRRRAHDALEKPALADCPNCKSVKPPHRICPMCGFYKGREVIELEPADKATS